MALISAWIDRVSKSGNTGLPLPGDVRTFLLQQGYDEDVIKQALSAITGASKTAKTDKDGKLVVDPDSHINTKPDSDKVVRGSDQYFGVERILNKAVDRDSLEPEQASVFSKIIRIIKNMRSKDRRYFVREIKRYVDE